MPGGRIARLSLLAAALLAGAAAPAAAHDVPQRGLVQAFVTPRGERLELLLRVPLILLLDEELPRRGRGFLDLDRIDAPLRDAAQRSAARLKLFEGSRQLTPSSLEARVARASDRSFETLAQARAHLAAPPLPRDVQVFWNQGFLDVQAEYPVASPASRFSLELGWPPGLAERIATSLRFLPDGGSQERAYLLNAGDGRVPLDPGAAEAAWRFVRTGAWHVLSGVDHLLFLVCLVLPARRLRELVLVATAFTLAHSITLVASVLGWAPSGAAFPLLVETLIAASIVYAAVENILVARPRHRARLAFGFGLVHGFGFAFALGESLQFAGAHLALSLAAFNVGIELGQLVAVSALALASGAVLARAPHGRLATAVLSAFVAHTGWHWMVERAELLRRVPRTPIGVADVAPLAPVLLVALLAGGALALGSRRWRRQVAPTAT